MVSGRPLWLVAHWVGARYTPPTTGTVGGCVLSKEQNKRFTEVGPGTSMGELLRRYWMPFATVKQLHDHPTRAVTLLGEHLVAYRDRSGNYGLIQEFCPHRNTNLL